MPTRLRGRRHGQRRQRQCPGRSQSVTLPSTEPPRLSRSLSRAAQSRPAPAQQSCFKQCAMLRSALRTPALRIRLPSYAPRRTLARPLTTHVFRAEGSRVAPRLASASAELRQRLLVTGACVAGVRTFHATSRNQYLPILPLLAGILKVCVETCQGQHGRSACFERLTISKSHRRPLRSSSYEQLLASLSPLYPSFSSRTTRSRESSRMQRPEETMPWQSEYAPFAKKPTYSAVFFSYPSSSFGRPYSPASSAHR